MVDTFQYIINKYKINVGRQYIVDVPGIDGRKGLAELFAELGFNKGAEIGVFKGKYSQELLDANPNLHLYGVDPWELAAHPEGVFKGGEKQELFDNIYEEAKKRLTPYKNFTFVKKYSMDALKDFEDNSLDFVYIDAGHDFVNFTLDLDGWLKKVRPGGIISGHDYTRFSRRKMIHVIWVLQAYIRAYGLIPLFTLLYKKHPTMDRYRSWFYVKK